MTKIVVLLGRPGSGKGTQGELLRDELGYVHLSTGEILRSAIRDQTELGTQAKEFVDAGRLVPDHLIVSLVTERLQSLIGGVPGIICDGFPRTVPQAVALSNALAQLGVPHPIVIELRVSNERASRRIEGRDADGNANTRSDDKREVVEARMAVYEAETRPVVDYYEGLGILRTVDGSGTREEVFGRVRDNCVDGLLSDSGTSSNDFSSSR